MEVNFNRDAIKNNCRTQKSFAVGANLEHEHFFGCIEKIVGVERSFSFRFFDDLFLVFN